MACTLVRTVAVRSIGSSKLKSPRDIAWVRTGYVQPAWWRWDVVVADLPDQLRLLLTRKAKGYVGADVKNYPQWTESSSHEKMENQKFSQKQKSTISIFQKQSTVILETLPALSAPFPELLNSPHNLCMVKKVRSIGLVSTTPPGWVVNCHMTPHSVTSPPGLEQACLAPDCSHRYLIVNQDSLLASCGNARKAEGGWMFCFLTFVKKLPWSIRYSG